MGVGGMAVAFGVQETVANIFSGLHLIITNQVKINDFIKLASGAEGRVTDINLRYTTITPAAEGSVIVIPNKDIAGAIMTNFSRPRRDVGIIVPIGVSYNSDLDLVERVTLEEARKVQMQWDDYNPDDANSPLHPAVLYQEFGDSSINFNAVLHASVYTKQLKIKHEFIKAISKRYREENIDIPFPIRTVMLPEENSLDEFAFSKKG
jgi:small-conductance mechanosensitive channel